MDRQFNQLRKVPTLSVRSRLEALCCGVLGSFGHSAAMLLPEYAYALGVGLICCSHEREDGVDVCTLAPANQAVAFAKMSRSVCSLLLSLRSRNSSSRYSADNAIAT